MESQDTPSNPGEGIAADASDGLIDFSQYTLQQLRDFRLSMDAGRFPLNAVKLRAELSHRESAPTSTESAIPKSEIVQFTRRGGWAGWREARRRRQRVYGVGSLHIKAPNLLLRGWQRTWLAVPVQSEVAVPLASIRNVASEGQQLWFEERVRHWWPRRYEVSADSAEFAGRIAAELPRESTEGFEEKWRAMRAFSQRMSAAGVRPWVTRVLVALNLVTFLVFVIGADAWTGIYPQQLMLWGANYGPLTTHGQWWRLVSALFLHASLMHVVVNMWVLWNVGRLTERLFGSSRFLLIYSAAGLVASFTSIAWDPSRMTVGASGAIFGVFGAFLAFLLNPKTKTPVALLRTHWLSTAVFVVFSLLNGYFQVGTDNAAHVGGLLMGLVLGWILAEPFTSAAAHRVRSGPVVAAGLAAALIIGLGFVQVHGIGTQLTPPQAFMNAHKWFVTGEEASLRRWRDYAAQVDAGSISQSGLAQGFKRDLLPFWESTLDRLKRERAGWPPEQKAYGADVLNYVQQRHDWILDISEADDGGSSNGTYYSKQLDKALARLERRQLDADATLQPHALSRLPWIARLRQLFSASDACVKPPAGLGHELDPHDQQSDGPALRAAIGCRAQRAYLNGDFADIESQLAAYRPDDVDPADGGSRRMAIMHGLTDLFEYGAVRVDNAVAAMADWRRQFPKSLMPDLVEANLFSAWAWSARGHGYAKEVSQVQWQQFAHRTAMASAVLEDIAERGRAEPLWYELRLAVGLDQSDSKDDLQALFDGGALRFPRFLPLYRTQLRNLMPRWGGSYDEVDRLITQTASDVGQGDSMYAQLYWIDADLEQDTEAYISESRIDWTRAKSGFEILLSRYPKSDAILNGYAYMACRAADKDQYRLLRQMIVNGRISRAVWPTRTSLESCDKVLM